jgi:hypothetical protein
MWPKQGGNVSMLKLTHLIEVIMIEELPGTDVPRHSDPKF